MSQESERHVHAVLGALSILEAYTQDQPLRLKDLHERTGLNRSRILRFAGTLRAAGFLDYDERDGTYSLGLKVYSLGSLLSRRVSHMAEYVRSALRRLAGKSGNTAFYSVLHGSERLVVAKEESSEGLRFIVDEGSRRPVLAGATGKVLLAFAAEEVRRGVLEQAPDRERLEAELAEVKAAGFAISRGEATPHGFAVAVPVPVLRGGLRTYDALTIAGPLGKLTDELAGQYVEMLNVEQQTLSGTGIAAAGGPRPDPATGEA